MMMVEKDPKTDWSLNYAKKHKHLFLEELLLDKPKNLFEKEGIFMAGSPGAGKSEIAESIQALDRKFVRIDADDFRVKFPGYNGANSSHFQRGASYLVDYCYTAVLKQSYSFILDGTFAIAKARQNVERSLNRGYKTTIYYVYQEPQIAWQFTKKREQKEGRVVPKSVFITTFMESRKNIRTIKKIFGQKVALTVIFRDLNHNISEIKNVAESDQLFLGQEFSRTDLEELLHDNL